MNTAVTKPVTVRYAIWPEDGFAAVQAVAGDAARLTPDGDLQVLSEGRWVDVRTGWAVTADSADGAIGVFGAGAWARYLQPA